MQRQSRGMRVIRRLDSGAYDGQDFLRDAQELGHRLRLLDEYGGLMHEVACSAGVKR